MLRRILLLAACLCSTAALAQDELDADTREVLAYTLSDAGLAKYIQATNNLAALADGMPGACDDDTGEGSIDEMAASLNAWPGASGAIRSAGMSTREYVVFSMSLVHNAIAAWSASQPGGSLPPGASQANADFVMRHEADLQGLNASAAGDDCDENYDEE